MPNIDYSKKMPGPEMNRIKKQVIKLFQDNGLKITIETSAHQVNFLDVTMDLNTGKFWPFRKDDNKLLYINKESNHPPSITRQLPAMIQDRVSTLSCDKEEFMKNKEPLRKLWKVVDSMTKSATHHQPPPAKTDAEEQESARYCGSIPPTTLPSRQTLDGNS